MKNNTSDVTTLGKSGEMKEVAEGYARNFLIPRKLAVPAAGGAFRAWQHDIANREDKRRREREEAEVSVRLMHNGRSMTARGSDPDTLVASAKAYLGALNKLVMKHERDKAHAAAAAE